MTEITQTNAQAQSTTRGKGNSSKSQFSLLTILLLSAAVATSFSAWRSVSALSRIEAQLTSLRLVACELKIDDPSKFAAVRKPNERYRAHSWDVYLPPQDSTEPYEVCLAIEKIAPAFGPRATRDLPTLPNETFALKPGRHRLEVSHHVGKEKGHEILVKLDEQEVIKISRPYDWQKMTGHGSRPVSLSDQQDTDEPLILLHRVFMVPVAGSPTSSMAPNDPSNGIRLWIRKR